MRRTMTLLLGISLGTLLTLPLPALAQTAVQDVKQKAVDAAESIRTFTVDRKDDAVAQAKKLARDLDGKIKQLEAKAKKTTGESKAKSDQLLKDLKEKRAKTSQKLAELGKASGAAWDNAKHGFADAYHDLAESFEKAAASFK